LKPYPEEIKQKAKELRTKGFSYTEIKRETGINIPKGTLSYWFHDVFMSSIGKDHIEELIKNGAHKGRAISLLRKKEQRKKYLSEIKHRNIYLKTLANNKHVAKIALAMLYVCEGKKYVSGTGICFGNSDPKLIVYFLNLLKKCFIIDKSKIKCTLQCRADQNTDELEKFWSTITKIPRLQFYKPLVDPRTNGIPTKRTEYKGVLRVEYHCAEYNLELKYIAENLMGP
jgi:hypothetical protein